MRIRHLTKTAYQGIVTHRGRSLLTVLGVVIGIAAIMAIVSLGTTAQKLIENEISGFGAELVVLRPGKQPSGPTDFAGTLLSDSVRERDVNAILQKGNVPHAKDASPVVLVPGSVSYRGDTYTGQTLGWSAEFMSSMLDVVPSEGTLFSESDIAGRAKVAVIGNKVRIELFGEADPIGENIEIKGVRFRVVGAFPAHGQGALFNVDELIIIPYTSAQTYILGTSHFNEVIILADGAQYVEDTKQDVIDTIRTLHRIDDPAKDDFYVDTSEGMLAQINTILGALTAFLSAVVAIALVVGGIGVMNIMLVSVTERTREVGLRKALGARRRDILLQFLLEAVFITAFGGVIGILFGTILSLLGSFVLASAFGFAWDFVFPFGAALLGIAVSVGVGLVFGIYPARKASLKSPIEALRYE